MCKKGGSRRGHGTNRVSDAPRPFLPPPPVPTPPEIPRAERRGTSKEHAFETLTASMIVKHKVK